MQSRILFLVVCDSTSLYERMLFCLLHLSNVLFRLVPIDEKRTHHSLGCLVITRRESEKFCVRVPFQRHLELLHAR